MSQSCFSRCLHQVNGALLKVSGDYIRFPETRYQQEQTKRDLFNIAGFPWVLGAIDCTHVQIRTPSENAVIYINRKGYHSINVQIISDPNLLISNIVAQWPGSTHDSRILLNSSIHTAFDYGIVQGFLLGDSGYALKPWLMTPYLNPQSPAQANYNRAHSKTWNTVERCIGVWKRRFHILHGEIRMAPDRVCAIICTTTALHNFARYG
ncbi:putative nuclease HARBI1 [Huso huso]|uniref:Putative nuclease HARBI1 n=1 Tax=Huso huso TaxID=61971 RepID=A0ABR0ZXV7_HUSHU